MDSATAIVDRDEKKILQEVLREHTELQRHIQNQTGCSALEAGLQAWNLMFLEALADPG
jgi:hypothetical protein